MAAALAPPTCSWERASTTDEHRPGPSEFGARPAQDGERGAGLPSAAASKASRLMSSSAMDLLLKMPAGRRWCMAPVGANQVSGQDAPPMYRPRGSTHGRPHEERGHAEVQEDRVQTKYRVKNWAAYEAALRKRGDITFWFDEKAIDAWNAPASGRPGGQHRYWIRCGAPRLRDRLDLARRFPPAAAADGGLHRIAGPGDGPGPRAADPVGSTTPRCRAEEARSRSRISFDSTFVVVLELTASGTDDASVGAAMIVTSS